MMKRLLQLWILWQIVQIWEAKGEYRTDKNQRLHKYAHCEIAASDVHM